MAQQTYGDVEHWATEKIRGVFRLRLPQSIYVLLSHKRLNLTRLFEAAFKFREKTEIDR